MEEEGTGIDMTTETATDRGAIRDPEVRHQGGEEAQPTAAGIGARAGPHRQGGGTIVHLEAVEADGARAIRAMEVGVEVRREIEEDAGGDEGELRTGK